MKNKLIIFLYLYCVFQYSLLAQNLRYNKNYSIACHNCYVPKDGRVIEDIFPYTTAIEIDIWDNSYLSGIAAESAHSVKMNGDWFVKHESYDKGNVNCCGGTFKDCLNRIKKWSDQNPDHSVITIFIDKKENWSETNEMRKPVDLDELLLSVFSREKIYTPIDLLGDKQSLKAAMIENCPMQDSLKGKFIFAITDGTTQLDIPIISPHRTPLNEYLDAQKKNAVCFVAPQISTEAEISQPKGFSFANSSNTIFYNLDYSNRSLAQKINSLDCLSRVFGFPLETKDVYKELVNDKINFIAFDNYQLLK